MELKKPEYHPDVAAYKRLVEPRQRDGEVAKREKARMARIPNSSTSREPGPNDVESFEESYLKCKLHITKGPLPK